MKKNIFSIIFAIVVITCTSGCYAAMNISTNDAIPLGDISVAERMFTATRLISYFQDPGELRLNNDPIYSWSDLTDKLDTSDFIHKWPNEYILAGDVVEESPTYSGLFLVETSEESSTTELYSTNTIHVVGENKVTIETENVINGEIIIGNYDNRESVTVNSSNMFFAGDVYINSNPNSQTNEYGNAILSLNGRAITSWDDIIEDCPSEEWMTTNFVHLDAIYEDEDTWQVINWLYIQNGNFWVSSESGITLGDETINQWGDLTNDMVTTSWVGDYINNLNIWTNYFNIAGGTVTGDTTFENSLTVVNDINSSGDVFAQTFSPSVPSMNTELDQGTGMYIYRNDQAETTTNLIINGSDGTAVIIHAGEDASIRVGLDGDESSDNTIEMIADKIVFNGLVSIKDSLEVGPNCYAPSSGAAIGNGNTANGLGAVAIGGEGNRALEENSIAMGYYADAVHSDSFIWNGTSSQEVQSKGEGTFAVVPKDGLEGFYVGETNLATILTDYITPATENAVNKTGDTMTGNLTVPELNSITIRNGTSALHGTGANTIANGDYLFTEGNNSFSTGKGTYGQTGYTISGGANTTTYSVSGSSSYVIEIGSIVRNSTNVAKVVSFDGSTLVVDKTLSTSGLNNTPLIHCDGVSYGEDTFVSGIGNTASGDYASAIGNRNLSTGEGAYAGGRLSRATNDYSFVWNASTTKYGSHGNGTYNINPTGGMGGFFVGETNMENFVNTKVQSYSPDHRARIVTTASSSVQLNDYLVWMDTSVSGTDQTFTLSEMPSVDFMTVVVRKIGTSTDGIVTVTDGTNSQTLTNSGDTTTADWVGAKSSWYFRP